MRSPAPASCHAAKQLLLCSLLAAAANGLDSDSVNEPLLLQGQQNTFFYSFISLFFFIFIFLQGRDTNRSFSCSSFAQTDDIRKYLCVISELRLNFWSKIQQSQHVKLELNVSSIQEIV